MHFGALRVLNDDRVDAGKEWAWVLVMEVPMEF